MANRDLSGLMETLGYRFKDEPLLRAALTHPSNRGVVRKGGVSPYERLEFLGDRVLGLVMAEWLYQVFPLANEGELAKRHAALVNRDALRDVARAAGLEKYLRLAGGQDPLAERKNLAAMADAMEGVIGAIYMDAGLRGLDEVRPVIRRFWEPLLHTTGSPPMDPKTTLQEWAQGKGYPLPTYRVVSSSGPAHAPRFLIEVNIEGFGAATAEGTSKRVAEKAAAEILLGRAG